MIHKQKGACTHKGLKYLSLLLLSLDKCPASSRMRLQDQLIVVYDPIATINNSCYGQTINIWSPTASEGLPESSIIVSIITIMEATCSSPKKRYESTSIDSNSNVWLIERKTRNLNTRHFSKLAISESCPLSQHRMLQIYSAHQATSKQLMPRSLWKYQN